RDRRALHTPAYSHQSFWQMQLEPASDVVPCVLEREIDVAGETDANARVELRPLPPETRRGMDRADAHEAIRDSARTKRRLNRLDPSELQRKAISGLDLPALTIETAEILFRELRDQRRVVPFAVEPRSIFLFLA